MMIKSPFTGGDCVLKVDKYEYVYKGVKLNVCTIFYECLDTKEHFTDAELDSVNMKLIKSEYIIYKNK